MTATALTLTRPNHWNNLPTASVSAVSTQRAQHTAKNARILCAAASCPPWSNKSVAEAILDWSFFSKCHSFRAKRVSGCSCCFFGVSPSKTLAKGYSRSTTDPLFKCLVVSKDRPCPGRDTTSTPFSWDFLVDTSLAEIASLTKGPKSFCTSSLKGLKVFSKSLKLSDSQCHLLRQSDWSNFCTQATSAKWCCSISRAKEAGTVEIPMNSSHNCQWWEADVFSECYFTSVAQCSTPSFPRQIDHCSLVGNAKGIPTFVKIELLVPTTCMDPRRPLQNYKQDRSTRNHVFNVGLSGKLHWGTAACLHQRDLWYLQSSNPYLRKQLASVPNNHYSRLTQKAALEFMQQCSHR